MGKVSIGGRDLSVLEQHEAGSFLVDVELARVGEELAAAKSGVEQFKKMAEIVLCYVKHNPDVSLDWLISVLPADIGPILRACVAATGRKPKDADTGEASRPQMQQ
jgi:hypothetical protein